MVKVLLILIIVAILMDDGISIKKTEEEKKEDEEVAKAVNRTLAEEEKRRKEEEDEAKKKKQGNEIKQEGKKDGGEDEASSTFNCTCPLVKPCKRCPEEPDCPSCEDCPQPKDCPAQEVCPEIEPCHPCEECGTCPEIKPCKPCPGVNNTRGHQECPEAEMSVPVAIAVRAVAGVLVTGVAAVLGLVIRYFSPLECGFLFLATIVMVWYFSSQHPETARELGGRAATLLREAAVALGHRMMAAIQRHQEQVSVPNLSLISSFGMSSMFQRICTKIFYVVEN
jgi:hypothetical protein